MGSYDDQVVARIEGAQADVADQLRRADTKAAMLLPLFGGFLAGVVALSTRNLPVAAEVVLWLAAVPMALSVLLLLWAVRPRISRHTCYGFAHFAGYVERPSELLEQFQSEPPAVALAADVCRLSMIVQTKYANVRRAVDLLVVGLLLLVVALVVTAAM